TAGTAGHSESIDFQTATIHTRSGGRSLKHFDRAARPRLEDAPAVWRELLMLRGNRSTHGAHVKRLSALSLVVIAAAMHAETAVSQDLRIDNVTIVSPERAREIDSATVTIRDGRVQSISTTGIAAPSSKPTALETLDGSNLFLIPGLIDSHVHL